MIEAHTFYTEWTLSAITLQNKNGAKSRGTLYIDPMEAFLKHPGLVLF